jgi:hypothetical protein
MNKVLLSLIQAVVATAVSVAVSKFSSRCEACEVECVECGNDCEACNLPVQQDSAVPAISGLLEKAIDEVPGIPAIVKMLLSNQKLISGIAQMVDGYADQIAHQVRCAASKAQ